MRQRYAIVIERAPANFSAYLPDVPGCVTTGPTVVATKRNMVEALQLHFDGLREDGEPIPTARTEPAAIMPRDDSDVIDTIEVDIPDGASVGQGALA